MMSTNLCKNCGFACMQFHYESIFPPVLTNATLTPWHLKWLFFIFLLRISMIQNNLSGEVGGRSNLDVSLSAVDVTRRTVMESSLLPVGFGTGVTEPHSSVKQHQVLPMGKQSGSSFFTVDKHNRSIHKHVYFGRVCLCLGTAVKFIVFKDISKLIRFD